MFEDKRNNIDDLDFGFRSILEEAQEPVPAHVWDRVEADLDKIAKRRVAVLWFRRSAISVAAAAAVAFGVFFGRGAEENLVSPVSEKDAVAVVEPQEEMNTDTETPVSEMEKTPALLAMAENVQVKQPEAPAVEEYSEETIEVAGTEETEVEPAEKKPAAERKPVTERKDEERVTYQDNLMDIWPEDEPQRNRIRTSVVLSGITNTNGAQNSGKVNPMKRPAISAAPERTGIKETSTNTSYGIPVSAGVGIKLDFTPRWSLGVGVNYTLLTRKFYGTYTKVGNDGGILKDVSSDIKGSQHYIGIPVNAYYNIVKQDKINFYVYAGGTAEKCIADKYQLLNTDITHTEKVKGMQYSTNLGMGAEFMLGQHFGIYIDPSLRYYFDCGQPKSIRTAQPLMFGFEMGFRIRL